MRKPANICLAVISSCLVLFVAGCGSSDDTDSPAASDSAITEGPTEGTPESLTQEIVDLKNFANSLQNPTFEFRREADGPDGLKFTRKEGARTREGTWSVKPRNDGKFLVELNGTTPAITEQLFLVKTTCTKGTESSQQPVLYTKDPDPQVTRFGISNNRFAPTKPELGHCEY